MGRHTASVLSLAVCCLLFIVPTACNSDPADGTASPTVPGVASVEPVATSTSPPAPTPTPSPEVIVPPSEPAATEPIFTEHTVQAGDTLLGLAMHYGLPMAALQMHNAMGSSTLLHAGQVLTIPPQIGWEGASPFWVLHVVEEGETLVGIGHTYGLSAQTLQSVNGLVDADVLAVGQELILPLDAPAVAQAPPTSPAAPPTPTPTPAAEATVPSPEPTVALSPPPANPPPADVAAWPYEVVRIINDVRAQHGLPPLAYNETLALAAQGHANDCSQRGWCSHTGSDGADLNTRLVRAGYSPSGRAECWAMSLSPQHAVDMWMDEVPPNDAHRRTLLTTYQTEIGVGVAVASWDYFYFIADFGRP
jgi:uncharacterized protein YkwD